MDLNKELQLIAAIYNAMQLVEVRGEENCRNHLWCMQQIKQVSASVGEFQEQLMRTLSAPAEEKSEDGRGDNDE